MKICVLQPDYTTSGVDYKNYDPARDLTHLLPGQEVEHILLNKLTTYKQLSELKKNGYDIYVNLCEGYLEWEVPSIDVIHSLELLNLPYTGPTATIYDPTKELMKYVAYCCGIKTPAYFVVDDTEIMDKKANDLKYPLFIKPAKAGDSLGIDDTSVLNNKEELVSKTQILMEEYGSVLVEEYIKGREFTVLVAANEDGKSCTVFKPVEYIFPEGKTFKTYSLKTSELHPDANRPVEDKVLENELKAASEKIFKAFNAVGYARLDFRMNDKNELFFLEINFTCSVFYKDGYEGSADFIVKYDGIGQAGFLNHIIREGISRHQRKQKLYKLNGDAIAGYGIYAERKIAKGELIFEGEGRSQRIITKRFVEKSWKEEEKLEFRRYAYAVSDQVYILWDTDAAGWAPQNHSCDANTFIDGLNVYAGREIDKGEELTLDYATLLDETMEQFNCNCASTTCRGLIKGKENNTVTTREKAANQ